MSFAILKYPKRLNTKGIIFQRGIRTPVSDSVAEALKTNPRFRVVITKPVEDNEDIGEQSVEAAEAEKSGRPKTLKDRVRAISHAFDLLDPENDTHYTTDGRPDARALTSILGWQVTSDERDKAMTLAVKDPARDRLDKIDGEDQGVVRVNPVTRSNKVKIKKFGKHAQTPPNMESAEDEADEVPDDGTEGAVEV